MKRNLRIIAIISILCLLMAPMALAVSKDTIYTDPKFGLKFTLPSGWEKDEYFTDEDAGYYGVSFYVGYSNNYLNYTSTDWWNEYMTSSDKSGLTRADIDNSYFTKYDIADMYELSESSVSMVTYNGVEYFKLTEYYQGENYIYITCFCDGVSYDFTYCGTVTDSYFSGFEIILNSVQFPDTIEDSSSTQDPNSYTDCYDVTFTIPDGWVQDELYAADEYTQVQFNAADQSGDFFQYGAYDYYAELEANGSAFFTFREDINNSYFTTEDIAEIIGVEKSSVSMVNYNGVEYFMSNSVPSAQGLVQSLSTNSNTPVNNFASTILVCAQNGMIYSFYYNGLDTAENFKAFKGVLNSVQYPAVEETFDNFDANFEKIGLTIFVFIIIIIAIGVYATPIIIYRYGVIKQPVAKNKSKKIVLVYSFVFLTSYVAFMLYPYNDFETYETMDIVFDVLCFAVIYAWSFVNYFILTKGKSKIQPQNNEIRVCLKCGCLVGNKDLFCTRCGAPVEVRNNSFETNNFAISQSPLPFGPQTTIPQGDIGANPIQQETAESQTQQTIDIAGDEENSK